MSTSDETTPTQSARGRPRIVSVIMPALDAAATIDRQLSALAEQSYSASWELVLADNGSTDDTRARAVPWFERIPGLRIVNATSRRGPNHARNVGVAIAKGDLLLFCDDDDVASEGWIAGMVDAAARYDLVGGAIDTELLNDRVVRGRRFEELQVTDLPCGLGYLPYSLSANLGIWKDVMKDLGGWNESFDRPGGDDVDLCWRAQLRSFSLGFAADAVMHYRYRSRLTGMMRQHFRYGAAEPLLYKNFRGYGLQRHPLKIAYKPYRDLVKEIPRLYSQPPLRADWLRRLAHLSGRIAGSAAHKVFFI